MEIWRKIPFMDYRYEVSNYGRIRSYAVAGSQYIIRDKPLILSQYNHRSGHKIVGFHVNGKTKQIRVHRIVASVFVENPNNYSLVLHKDDDPSNNHADNLYWGTYMMNTDDLRRNRGHMNEGELSHNAILTEKQVIEIKNRIFNTNEFYKDIAKDYGVSDTAIRHIKNGSTWGHVKLECENKPVPVRKMLLSTHHMARKFRHKETGRIFDCGKEAAKWAGINYGTMISRVNSGSQKSLFEKLPK